MHYRPVLATLCLALVAATSAVAGPDLAITGVVRDASGQPLERAQVMLLPAYEPETLFRAVLATQALPPAVLETVTDRAGAYQLVAPRLGMWRLAVSAAGCAPHGVELIPLVREIHLPDLVLEPATETEIQVVDERGTPLAGAMVLLRPRVPARGERKVPWTADDQVGVTDAAGRARLLAPGIDADVLVVAPGRPSLRTELGRARLVVPSGPSVRFQVVDRDARPVAGVLVQLAPDLPAALSDEQGRVLLASANPALSLRLSSTDAQTATWRGDAATVDGATLVLDPPRHARGRVVDPRMESTVAGLLVWLEPFYTTTTVSAADGSFDLAYPAQASPFVDADGPRHRLRYPVPAGDGTPFDLRLDSLVIVHGIVLDPEGEPLEDVKVQFPTELGTEVWQWPLSVRTDAHGRFVSHPLELGPYLSVVVEHPPFATWSGAPDRRKLDADLEIRLGHGIEVRGQVVDSESLAPIEGSTISLLQTPGSHHRSADVDGEGRFAFDNLGPATYLLKAEAPHHAGSFLPFEIAPDDPDRSLDRLELEPLQAWAGIVEDEEGRPLAGCQLQVTTAFDPAEESPFVQGLPVDVPVVTTDQGEFEMPFFERMPDSPYLPHLLVIAEGHVRDLSRLPEEPTRDLRIRLRAGLTVEGRVTNLHGEPIRGAEVYVLPAGTPVELQGWFDHFPGGIRYAVSDAAGRVRVTSLAEGDWDLWLVAPKHSPGRLSVHLPATLPEPFTIALEGTGTVIVRAHDLAADPVAGASIAFESLSGWGAPLALWQVTDVQGRAVVQSVPPGTWRVTVSLDDVSAAETITLDETTEVDVTLAVESGWRYDVQLVDDDGHPVADLPVDVLIEEADASWSTTAQTRADGTVSFDRLPAEASIQIASLGPGWALRGPAGQVRRLHTEPQLVHVQPTATLRGSIRLPYEAAGWSLSALGETEDDERDCSLWTTQRRWSVDDLPAGTWTFVLVLDDQVVATQVVEVAPGLDAVVDLF